MTKQLVLIRKMELSYGHCVSLQKLSKQESLNSLPKCRRFHGHNSNIEIHLCIDPSHLCINSSIGDELGEYAKYNEELQMITDSNNLKGLEAEINKYFDHKTYVSNLAPELNSIMNFFKIEDAVDVVNNLEVNLCSYLNDEVSFINIVDETKFSELCKKINVDVEVQKNYFKSFLIVKGETTIENMSRILFNFVQNYLDDKLNRDLDTKFIDSDGKKIDYDVKCKKIVWSETNKSSAEYSEVF